MQKYSIVVIDPPYSFSDGLNMSNVKRSAKSHYDTMSIDKLKALPINEVTDDNAVLALWVISSQLQEGLDLMKSYGFIQKQTWIWVKTKKDPLEYIVELCKSNMKNMNSKTLTLDQIKTILDEFDLTNILSFGMGHLGRNTHEICLIGIKGKIYDKVENKSQRTVLFCNNIKHSTKPEALQDKLDIIFPDKNMKRLEIFGRRLRDGWDVIGNESPSSFGVDINDSLKAIIKSADGYISVHAGTKG